MKISVIADDKTIILEGEALSFDFAIDSNIHAIQWRETWGNIEYKKGAQTWFNDANLIMPFLTAFKVEKERLAALGIIEAEKAAIRLAERQAALANQVTAA